MNADLDEYLPRRVNVGRWLTSYTLYELRKLDSATDIVLPICPMGTQYRALAELGDLVLPPLFHEALTEPLKRRIVSQINACFPDHEFSREGRPARPAVRVVEVSGQSPLPPPACPEIVAFSIDTAVEEHGPHLPLATDTIQSYAVLRELKTEFEGLVLGPPLDYGQLTWGLPFGFSIDLTAELLREYVARFLDALIERLRPHAVYVVDVHGSIVHRQAIVDGLRDSRCERWAFRWLYEPLAEFAAQRKDQHAGGVETALVERASFDLVDRRWWPGRIDELAQQQMPLEKAVELSSDLAKFVDIVRSQPWNGIVGDIRNYHHVDSDLMFDRMLEVARADVQTLLAGQGSSRQDAGERLW